MFTFAISKQLSNDKNFAKMTSNQIKKAVNGLTISQAKNFMENISGLKLEKMYEYPYQVCYSVLESNEIVHVNITENDLVTRKVKATFCFIC